MPSSRFFKLPDEKRSKILRAVHSELAEFPVDELSINRIIHSAGISRGSLRIRTICWSMFFLISEIL